MKAYELQNSFGIDSLTLAGQVDPTPILMKNVCVQGIFVGGRAMFEAMNDTIARHRMRPIVDRVFPFSELPGALRQMERGAHFGKIAFKAQ